MPMSDSEYQEMKLGQSIRDSLGNDDNDSDAARLRRGHTSYVLLRLAAKLGELEHKSRFFGTDVEIHNAEIHMIMAIHEDEGIHVGGLAAKLKITKGSVSELLRKLERKGLINKKIDLLKLSRLNIYLTEKGRVAHEHHVFFHERLNEIIDQAMRHHTTGEVGFLAHFLNDVLSSLESFEGTGVFG